MGSVLLGAVIALIASVGTAALQARLQRRAAREQYLWSKRTDLYQDILRLGSGQIAHMDDDEVDDQYGWTPDAEELRRDLTARVQLFGSPAAEECWRVASQASQRLDFYVRENWLQMGSEYVVLRPEARSDAGYLNRRGEVERTRSLLVEQLRADLATDKHLKRSN
ncbi:hypothetical protein ACFWAF_03300 [Streptomyces microflavus]|uniref:hypothetical protein n=1 Tax=Streptomyces microflavus TaxID=1919 RepID=UPI00365730D5